MTVQYIKADQPRVSAALECRRFTGSHTFEHIAELICEIRSDYAISVGKIAATVTDNASNFSKKLSEIMWLLMVSSNMKVRMMIVYSDEFR